MVKITLAVTKNEALDTNFLDARDLVGVNVHKMSTFSEQALLEKLERLSSSQDSIETLSLWMIHHRLHASASVEAWLQCFVNCELVVITIHSGCLIFMITCAAGPDKRLLLIYLANDILQNSRRRGADEFLELFKPPLRRVASLTQYVNSDLL